MHGIGRGLLKGWFIRAVTVSAAVFLLSCAKQGYPPGGKVDKAPPRVIKTIPAPNAVDVSKTTPLLVEFSESMDEKSVEENLFIVPIPSEWPDFEWRSRSRVFLVRFKHALRESTTYVVTIGSKAQDLRRNNLDTSMTLCFSTGSVLENKKLRGVVSPFHFLSGESEKIAAVDVVAYKLGDSGKDPDPRNDVPDYFSQTGTGGVYELLGLSKGTYRLYAIGDRDKDGFYTEGYDYIGVMPRDVVLADSDSAVSAPGMTISMRYTSEMQLTSMKAQNNRHVELFFDRFLNQGTFAIEIENLPVTGWYFPGDEAKSVVVATEPQEGKKRYIVKRLEARDIDSNTLSQMETEPFFQGNDRPDTTSLEINEWNPKIMTLPKEAINIEFNRVLALPDTLQGIIQDDSGEELAVRRTGSNSLEITPVRKWRSGYNYIILLDREIVRSTSGNTLTGQGSQLTLRSAPQDTLGTIEGMVTDIAGDSTVSYHIFIKSVSAETVRTLLLSGTGGWSSGPVLPGRYVCGPFIDDFNDGKLFRGSVYPFKPAEQFTVYPDTVVVESRWSTKNVDFIFR